MPTKPGLVPTTTLAYRSQSNGLAEAFIGTFKRDYLGRADLCDGQTVLAQLDGRVGEYNTRAPHSTVRTRSPAECRAELTLSSPGLQ